MQNWDIALDELNRLKEIIDSKVLAAYPTVVFGIDQINPFLGEID